MLKAGFIRVKGASEIGAEIHAKTIDDILITVENREIFTRVYHGFTGRFNLSVSGSVLAGQLATRWRRLHKRLCAPGVQTPPPPLTV